MISDTGHDCDPIAFHFLLRQKEQFQVRFKGTGWNILFKYVQHKLHPH